MRQKYFFIVCALTMLFCACEEPISPPVDPTEPEPIKVVAPIADFSYKLQQPLSASFSNQSSGEITKLQWDFGDGQTSTLSNPTHRYNMVGEYTVTLTVSNSAGSSRKRTTLSILTPKVYVKGVKYLKIGKPDVYYRSVCKDDDFFTTTWWNSGYTPLLSTNSLPYSYIFAIPVEMTGLNEDDYYTVYVYWNTKTNGDGTQILRQRMETSDITQYPEEITLTSNNSDTQIRVIFNYQ